MPLLWHDLSVASGQKTELTIKTEVMSKLENLKDLLEYELQDLYSAEK